MLPYLNIISLFRLFYAFIYVCVLIRHGINLELKEHPILLAVEIKMIKSLDKLKPQTDISKLKMFTLNFDSHAFVCE